ncbi:unnamed protein product, partial [Laminaria digitata]
EHQAQEDQEVTPLSPSIAAGVDVDGGGRCQKTALSLSRRIAAAEQGAFSLRMLGRSDDLPLEHARGLSVDGSPSTESPLAESSSPTGGTRSGGSPPSRLRPPSAGRRRPSSPTSPVSAPRLRDRDSNNAPSPYSTSSSPPPPPQQQQQQQRQRRRLLS